MPWTHAGTVFAEMVELKTLWNGANVVLVIDPVSGERLATNADLPVSILVGASKPEPASGSFCDTGFEFLAKCGTTPSVHLRSKRITRTVPRLIMTTAPSTRSCRVLATVDGARIQLFRPWGAATRRITVTFPAVIVRRTPSTCAHCISTSVNRTNVSGYGCDAASFWVTMPQPSCIVIATPPFGFCHLDAILHSAWKVGDFRRTALRIAVPCPSRVVLSAPTSTPRGFGAVFNRALFRIHTISVAWLSREGTRCSQQLPG